MKIQIWSIPHEDVTLGTRGFSRVRREFSVLAEGRHILLRYHIKHSSPMVKNAKKNLYVWFFWSFTPVSFYFSSWMEECFVWPWNMVFVKILKQGVVGWGQYSIFLFACCIIFVHAFSERYHFKVKRLSLIDEFKKRNSFFVKNLT